MIHPHTTLTLMALFWFGIGATTHSQEPQKVADMAPYCATVPGTRVQIDLIPIRVGTPGFSPSFRMGSPDDELTRRTDEGPTFTVTVAPFWMARCEVTWDTFNEFRRQYAVKTIRLNEPQADLAAWVDAVSLPTPLWEQDSAPILKGLGVDGGYPAADISNFAARQFCKWLSKKTGQFYRLPTESEWEYAARAGTDSAWFFGNDPTKLTDFAWYFDNSAYDDPEKGYPGTGMGYRQVGLKKANPWGLHDVYGNVAEWVIDAYAPDHYQQFKDKSVSWTEAVRHPRTIYPITTRGGHWESEPGETRSACRFASNPKWQYRDPQIPKSIWWFTDAFNVGFRIVRPLAEPTAAEKQEFWDGQIPAINNIIEKGGKQARVRFTPEPAK